MNKREHGRLCSFLSVGERRELMAVVQQCKVEVLNVRSVNVRSVNVLLLLDNGRPASFIARVLFLDANKMRGWCRTFEARGFIGIEIDSAMARAAEKRIASVAI